MLPKGMPNLTFAFALAAGCNWLAGIDERETAQVTGGKAGVTLTGGQSGRSSGGVSGAKPNVTSGGTGDAGAHQAGAGGTSPPGDNASGAGVMAAAGGAAGDNGIIHGGVSSTGGGKGSGGAPATGGTAAGAAGSSAEGGSTNTGGATGKGGSTSAGGTKATGGSTSTGTGTCLDYPNELVAKGWYINTGGTMIEPPTTDQESGLFQEDGACACVENAPGTGSAEFYFHKSESLSFTTLDITLASTPGKALPRLYVRNKKEGKLEQKKYCRLLSEPDEIEAVYEGRALRFRHSDFTADCNDKTTEQLPARNEGFEIKLVFTEPGSNEAPDFELCVLAISVD